MKLIFLNFVFLSQWIIVALLSWTSWAQGNPNQLNHCNSTHRALAETSVQSYVLSGELRNRLEFHALTLLRLQSDNMATPQARQSVLQTVNAEISQIRSSTPNFDEIFKSIFSQVREKYQTGKKQEVAELKERQRQTEPVERRFAPTRGAFNRVEPGSFMMGIDQSVHVIISKPFELAQTLTTQMTWRQISDLAKEKSILADNFPSSPSEYKGDLHPVENMSYDEVILWINAINKLSTNGESKLSEIIPGHVNGDRYRLPSEAEWEFVVRGRGEFYDLYYFTDDAVQLQRYAWLDGNSGGTTQPVKSLEPILVENMPFYHMLGNVSEWIGDWYHPNLFGGTDPVGPLDGTEKVLRSGSYFNENRNFDYRGKYPTWGKGSFIGFRLAREAL